MSGVGPCGVSMTTRLLQRRTGRHAHTALLAAPAHAPAFVRTTAARMRTFLAMRHLVLAAFITACVADFGACLADQRGEFTAARHVGCCAAAYLRAVHVERDATRHHLDVIFLQAGSGAKIACVGACIASFNTRFILLLSHGDLLEQVDKSKPLLPGNLYTRTRHTGRVRHCFSLCVKDAALCSVRTHA